ncbi:transmembrane protein 41A [Seminavis robusta]|uniref:Transmembrane protein 41A n=1 Tax=Seminavis robusta TaxID=568900 RepID=A0A9N8F0Y4_9STRA|nr:transmembrane protein 41A [Seminavis robusta]|eukprot:Sro2906_g339970.1 transmembrane protein 41A (372) ;mRNA; f:2697-3812
MLSATPVETHTNTPVADPPMMEEEVGMEELSLEMMAEEVSMEESSLESEQVMESTTTNSVEEEMERQTKKACYTRLVVGLVFVAFVVFFIVDSITNMHALDAIQDFLKWVENNAVAGVFVFSFVYLVATVFFIPGAILTLGAGFTFGMAFGLGAGVVVGTLAVFLGAGAGAIVSFLLGRYLLRQQMQRLTKKYAIMEALEAALEKKGLRIFILLRLSPIIPFNVINYVAGVTSVSFRDYSIALFAILPGTILYVFLGASAGSLADSAMSGDNSTVTIIVAVVGAVFGFLAIFVTTRFAKKELNRVLEERRQADEEAIDEEAGQIQPKDDSSTHDMEEDSGNMSGTSMSLTVSQAEPTPTPTQDNGPQEFDA